MSVHRTNTFAYEGARESSPGPLPTWDNVLANWTSLSAIPRPSNGLVPTENPALRHSCPPVAQLSSSPALRAGDGAIRRNESTNQHTQQIRQQDADAVRHCWCTLCLISIFSKTKSKSKSSTTSSSRRRLFKSLSFNFENGICQVGAAPTASPTPLSAHNPPTMPPPHASPFCWAFGFA